MKCFLTITGLAMVLSVVAAPQGQHHQASSGNLPAPTGGFARPSGGFPYPSGGYPYPSGGFPHPSGAFPSGGFPHPTGTGDAFSPHPTGSGRYSYSAEKFKKRGLAYSSDLSHKAQSSGGVFPGGVFSTGGVFPTGAAFPTGTGSVHHGHHPHGTGAGWPVGTGTPYSA